MRSVQRGFRYGTLGGRNNFFLRRSVETIKNPVQRVGCQQAERVAPNAITLRLPGRACNLTKPWQAMAITADQRFMATMTADLTATRKLLIPDIAWVEIPGGQFLYGEQRETRELPSFWIARYPVTNQQYQTFIDDGGYEDDRWWRDLKKPEQEESRWPQPNRPKTNVNWYEAMAFCRWLTARLGQPEDGIRLPTELEWERAARGEKGLKYPWGNEYRSGFANVDEKDKKDGPWYLEQTTAVGLYPHGDSPDQVEDLAGTVWEWCLNKHGKPEETQADTSDDWRVLRGGSWFHLPRLVRAALRGNLHPEARNDGGGFRVLSSFPISS